MTVKAPLPEPGQRGIATMRYMEILEVNEYTRTVYVRTASDPDENGVTAMSWDDVLWWTPA